MNNATTAVAVRPRRSTTSVYVSSLTALTVSLAAVGALTVTVLAVLLAAAVLWWCTRRSSVEPTAEAVKTGPPSTVWSDSSELLADMNTPARVG